MGFPCGTLEVEQLFHKVFPQFCDIIIGQIYSNYLHNYKNINSNTNFNFSRTSEIRELIFTERTYYYFRYTRGR